MRRFRFHLGSLVLIVLVISVSLASLRESNEIWDSGVFTLTLGMLLTSVLLAIHRTEARRAYWLGFALFGTAYLGLSLVPPIETRLVTTKALAFMDSRVPKSMTGADALYDLLVVNEEPNALYLDQGNGTFQDVTASAGLSLGNQVTNQGGLFLNVTSGQSLMGSTGTTENFLRIGHTLLALIAAIVGGQLSRRLYGTDREPVHEPARPRESHSPVGSGDRADG
jgi:hypothetical protein